MNRLFPLHSTFLRPAVKSYPYHALLNVLQQIEMKFPLPSVLIGKRSVEFQCSVETLSALLDWPEAQFGGLHFSLGAAEAFALLSYRRDRTFTPKVYDSLFLQMGREQVGLATAEEVITFFTEIAVAFESTLGGLYHPDQKKIALHTVLANAIDDITLPTSVEAVTSMLPEDLTPMQLALLSAACHPREFDRSKVPETLWWTNYFSSEVIDVIGRSAIDNVDWYSRTNLKDGAILIATEYPPRFGDTHGLDKLAEIASRLKLQQLQLSSE